MKKETQNSVTASDDMDKEYMLKPGDRMFGLYFPDDVVHAELIWASSTPSQHLAEAAKKDKPPKTFEEMVPEEFCNLHDVFSKDSYDKLPDWKPWDHHINFKPGTMTLPPPVKLFPLSPVEQKELNVFLTENLASRWIHPSKSPMGTPVFFTKNKDGGFWLVQDYQKLNDIMIKNVSPLLLISNVINQLRDT